MLLIELVTNVQPADGSSHATLLQRPVPAGDDFPADVVDQAVAPGRPEPVPADVPSVCRVRAGTEPLPAGHGRRQAQRREHRQLPPAVSEPVDTMLAATARKHGSAVAGGSGTGRVVRWSPVEAILATERRF
uniref:(northern house mosquito) hypothetical protein n=1 Tax=Culex pipiens TaxID=7175 RepID=A0A8D8NQE9_CULPI